MAKLLIHGVWRIARQTRDSFLELRGQSLEVTVLQVGEIRDYLGARLRCDTYNTADDAPDRSPKGQARRTCRSLQSASSVSQRKFSGLEEYGEPSAAVSYE